MFRNITCTAMLYANRRFKFGYARQAVTVLKPNKFSGHLTLHNIQVSVNVLTATLRSYGKGQISTAYKIRTPERIGMKFGTVDYVWKSAPEQTW